MTTQRAILITMDQTMETIDFQHIVDNTVTTLPDQFRKVLNDVLIVIEPHPRPRNGRISRTLLGLYEGIPLTEWSRDFNGKPPDKITLYRENILRYAKDVQELPQVIRETLLHEIGHYFGLDHDRIGKMEKRWKEGRKQSS
jgi:predicted Zn-dependent protease with MMP-like domain